jgi:hypothetical protein
MLENAREIVKRIQTEGKCYVSFPKGGEVIIGGIFTDRQLEAILLVNRDPNTVRVEL